MKILLFSDPHFGNHQEFANYNEGGLNSRLLLQIEAIDTALEWGHNNGCRRCYILGDIFHFRGYVEPEVRNAVAFLLDERAEFYDFRVLTGNHDITVEGPYFNTAMTLSENRLTHVVWEPEVDGDGSLWMPATKNFEERLEGALKNFRLKREKTILYMHQAVIGSVYGTRITKGVDPSILKGFKAVFCGDIHQPQKIGNVQLVGAPYPINFGDSAERYVYIVENGKIVNKMTPPHPRFLTIKDRKNYNSYDFFRFQTKEIITNAPANVRVVTEKEQKQSIRVKVENDTDLLAAYCNRNNKPGMLGVGLRYLEKANAGRS